MWFFVRHESCSSYAACTNKRHFPLRHRVIKTGFALSPQASKHRTHFQMLVEDESGRELLFDVPQARHATVERSLNSCDLSRRMPVSILQLPVACSAVLSSLCYARGATICLEPLDVAGHLNYVRLERHTGCWLVDDMPAVRVQLCPQTLIHLVIRVMQQVPEYRRVRKGMLCAVVVLSRSTGFHELTGVTEAYLPELDLFVGRFPLLDKRYDPPSTVLVDVYPHPCLQLRSGGATFLCIRSPTSPPQRLPKINLHSHEQ